MNAASLTARQQRARELVRRAGHLVLERYRRREELCIERKGCQDFVSEADREVESFLRRELLASFPEDGFFGEEEGGELCERLWVVDPIDGTANFLRGIPYWSVTLAYVEEGRPRLAFTLDPIHDELFEAREGAGATRDGRPIRVSGAAGPEEACIGFSYLFRTPPERYAACLRACMEAGFDHRRLGSAALSLAHVADGRLDAAVALEINSWDVIGGLLLVREAGGAATDFGARLATSRGTAAAAPGIAAAVTRLTGIPLPGA